ncbi:MAG: hypothetical protein AAFP89_27260, partial [Bacteroidota bacterium]
SYQLQEIPLESLFNWINKETAISLSPSQLADLRLLILYKQPQTTEALFRLIKLLWLQDHRHEFKIREAFDKHCGKLLAELAQVKQLTLEEEPEKERAPDTTSASKDLDRDSRKDDLSPSNPVDDSSPYDLDEDNEEEAYVEEKDISDGPEAEKDVWLSLHDVHTDDQETGEGIPRYTESTSTLLDHPYIFREKFWPISTRKLEQRGRYFRSQKSKVEGRDINVLASLNKLIREGMLDTPLYQQVYKKESVPMYILSDYSAEMIPYLSYTRYITESLVKAIQPDAIRQYFFINHIDLNGTIQELGKNRDISYTKEWLHHISSQSIVLIFSDAGTTFNDSSRMEDIVTPTIHFLQELKKRTKRTIWFNPTPRNRWYTSAAFYISMFIDTIGPESENLLQTSELLKKW